MRGRSRSRAAARRADPAAHRLELLARLRARISSAQVGGRGRRPPPPARPAGAEIRDDRRPRARARTSPRAPRRRLRPEEVGRAERRAPSETRIAALPAVNVADGEPVARLERDDRRRARRGRGTSPAVGSYGTRPGTSSLGRVAVATTEPSSPPSRAPSPPARPPARPAARPARACPARRAS